MPAARVHLLMGALLVARLLHPLGMYVGPRTLQFQICRVGGIVLTILVLIASALLLVWRSLTGAISPQEVFIRVCNIKIIVADLTLF